MFIGDSQMKSYFRNVSHKRGHLHKVRFNLNKVRLNRISEIWKQPKIPVWLEGILVTILNDLDLSQRKFQKSSKLHQFNFHKRM